MQSRAFLRMVSLFLALTMVVVGFPFSAEASEDYTQWKQADPRWNRQEAWPQEQYPEAPRRSMAEGGDPVTALCHAPCAV